jgi:hypothetical protein
MDGAELTEAIRERAERHDLDGAIVRLKVTDAPAGMSGEVDRALLRELRGRCLSFSLEVSAAASGQQDDASTPAAFGSLEEEFRGFVEGKRREGELDEAFAGEFLRRGIDYLQRAGEKERVEQT